MDLSQIALTNHTHHILKSHQTSLGYMELTMVTVEVLSVVVISPLDSYKMRGKITNLIIKTIKTSLIERFKT